MIKRRHSQALIYHQYPQSIEKQTKTSYVPIALRTPLRDQETSYVPIALHTPLRDQETVPWMLSA